MIFSPVQHLFRLGDDLPPQGDGLVQGSGKIFSSPAVKGLHHLLRLFHHRGGHGLQLFDPFSPFLPVPPIELLDGDERFLPDPGEGSKGFPEGHLPADPLNNLHDLLLCPVQKIDIGGIGHVLRLGRGIDNHLPGLHETHVPLVGKKDFLDPLHSLCPDPVPELHQGGRIEDLPPLEALISAEGLPVGVLVEHVHRRVIGCVVPVLQDVDPHHEADRLSRTADGTVIRGQNLMKLVPVNQFGGTNEFMVRVQDLGEAGF